MQQGDSDGSPESQQEWPPAHSQTTAPEQISFSIVQYQAETGLVTSKVASPIN